MAALVLAILTASGCGGHRRIVVQPPPPPPAAPETVSVPRKAKPIYVETGMASWYGPQFHNRTAANGELFDMNQLTAAHRTFPLNSVVRVTNIKTGHSTLVRITDRGPFVPDRIIDLSMAAAKEVDVWRAGTARVRLEVLQAPAPIGKGGRWCVQIGSLEKEKTARRLQVKLAHRYRTAKVLAFASPAGGWWVRVRVPEDDRRRADQVVRETTTPEGNIFLVRLD